MKAVLTVALSVLFSAAVSAQNVPCKKNDFRSFLNAFKELKKDQQMKYIKTPFLQETYRLRDDSDFESVYTTTRQISLAELKKRSVIFPGRADIKKINKEINKKYKNNKKYKMDFELTPLTGLGDERTTAYAMYCVPSSSHCAYHFNFEWNGTCWEVTGENIDDRGL